MIPSNTFQFDLYHYEVVEEKIPAGFLWLDEKTVYAIRRIPKLAYKDENCGNLHISYSKANGKHIYAFEPNTRFYGFFEVLYFDTPEKAKSVLETARENKVMQKYNRSSDAIYSTQDDDVSFRGLK